MKLTLTTLDVKWEYPQYGPRLLQNITGSVVIALDDAEQAREVAESGNPIDEVLDIAREALEREGQPVEVAEWDVDVNFAQLRATVTPKVFGEVQPWAR